MNKLNITTDCQSTDCLKASGFGLLRARESNAKTYARTFDCIIQRGLGTRVWDSDGKEYLDMLACAGALPLGHNHPAILDEVFAFLRSGQIQQGLDIATPAKVAFTEELMDSLPVDFAQSVRLHFCGPTGSDAVEAAIKLFKTATGRRAVIAFSGGYHGMTMGALSLMGNLNPKAPVSGLSAETHFFPYPNSKRCPFGVGGIDGERLALQYIDNALSDPESGITKPALILLEAVQGEGGCIPAPDEWLRGLREIATRHDVPLVIDEVQTGFGRTGSMFAFAHAGIRPDAIILSKALGGGYPLALIAYDAKYDKWAPGAHTGTFRGNQIAMVAGAATMRLLRDKNIVGHAQEMGARLQQGLKALAREFHCIGDVRGRGLMVGAEIVSTEGKLDGSLAKAVKVECFQLGMIIETGGRHGAVLRFLPSLLIEPADIDLALRLLGQSITNVRASEQARCRLQHTELDSVFLSTHLQKNDI